MELKAFFKSTCSSSHLVLPCLAHMGPIRVLGNPKRTHRGPEQYRGPHRGLQDFLGQGSCGKWVGVF